MGEIGDGVRVKIRGGSLTRVAKVSDLNERSWSRGRVNEEPKGSQIKCMMSLVAGERNCIHRNPEIKKGFLEEGGFQVGCGKKEK